MVIIWCIKFKIWFTIGLKNPRGYVQAYVKQTSGYYFHNFGRYWVYLESLYNDGIFGKVDVERKIITPDSVTKMIDKALDINSSIYYRLWSSAMGLYVILFGLFIAIEKKRNILPYVPTLAVVLTLLIATPVANEFRYAYCVFIAFPFLLLMSLCENKKKKLSN